MSLKIIVTNNYKEMSKKAANIIAGHINIKNTLVLGLATGSTPEGTYDELIDLHKNDNVDFANVKTINLDEYVGISGNHPQSYRYYMENKFFKNINIKEENTFLPNGHAQDIQKECENYDTLIKNLGGVDFQLLGIGENGHIAFNEPNKYFTKSTNHTNLTQTTIESNARFFDSIDEVPKTAITMGIGSIFKARSILLLASGEKKAEIVKKAFFGEITPEVPASILQLHSDVTVIIDEGAAKFV